MTKKCIICGREFQAKVGHQKTCGLKCSRENRRRLIVQAHRQRRRISPEVQLLYRERAEDREARKLAREERRGGLMRVRPFREVHVRGLPFRFRSELVPHRLLRHAIYCAACHTRVTVEYVDGVRIERRGFIPAGARAVKTVSHN